MKKICCLFIFSLFTLFLDAETNLQNFYKSLGLPDLSSYSEDAILKTEEWLKRSPQELEKDLPVLLKGLNDSDDEIRRAASGLSHSILFALISNTSIQDNKAEIIDRIVPDLIVRLDDADAKVMENAALAIAVLNTPPLNAREPMLRLLKIPQTQIKRIALSALGRIRPTNQDVINGILNVLKEDPVLKMEAIESLGELKVGDKAVVAALSNALSDNWEYVRMAALKALMNIGPTAIDTAPDIAEKAKNSSESEMVRIAAISALYKIAGNSRLVVSTSVDLLKDSNVKIKIADVNLIEKLGAAAQAAIPELERIITDSQEDKVLREKASAVLRYLQGNK
jgi:HEAT repeat protein